MQALVSGQETRWKRSQEEHQFKGKVIDSGVTLNKQIVTEDKAKYSYPSASSRVRQRREESRTANQHGSQLKPLHCLTQCSNSLKHTDPGPTLPRAPSPS